MENHKSVRIHQTIQTLTYVCLIVCHIRENRTWSIYSRMLQPFDVDTRLRTTFACSSHECVRLFDRTRLEEKNQPSVCMPDRVCCSL